MHGVMAYPDVLGKERYGGNTTFGSVRRKFNQERKTKDWFSNSRAKAIRTFYMEASENSDSYVTYIFHRSLNDEAIRTEDQMRVSILMCNRKGFRRCLQHPKVWCDGTFNIMSSNPTHEVTYELNRTVEKYLEPGRIF